MNKKKILIIEDETIIALNVQEVLEMKGYELCDIGISANEAVTLTEKHNPDLVLMDIILDGDKDGIAAVEEIKKNMIYQLCILQPIPMRRPFTGQRKPNPTVILLNPSARRNCFQQLILHCTNIRWNVD